MITFPSPSARAARPDHEAGFTLTELLVAGAVMALALLGILALFDLNRELARSQTLVADLQQSVRVAQNEMVHDVRMAGRGGLGRGLLPEGLAVAVRNNTPASGGDSYIAVGDNATDKIVAGTDVLTVRGVFSTPIYQLNPAVGGLVLDDALSPTQGRVTVQNPVPNSGIAQDLQPLFDAKANDPLLLVSPLGAFAVVAVTGVNRDSDDQVTLSFAIGTVGDSNLKGYYIGLTNGFPAALRTVAHAGLMEEYRYYVREDYVVSGATSGDLAPKLARARFLPNSQTLHPDQPGEDVADNVFDLQVALGVDTANDERIDDTASGADDWLFNSPDDLDSTGALKTPTLWNNAGSLPRLYYVRLTTLARTDLRDRDYQAPLLTTVEDKDYTQSPHSAFNSRTERMYRRRTLTTVVDLRNLS